MIQKRTKKVLAKAQNVKMKTKMFHKTAKNKQKIVQDNEILTPKKKPSGFFLSFSQQKLCNNKPVVLQTKQ